MWFAFRDTRRVILNYIEYERILVKLNKISLNIRNCTTIIMDKEIEAEPSIQSITSDTVQ